MNRRDADSSIDHHTAACTCQPPGGLPHGEHPYDYGYDDPADCPVHGEKRCAASPAPKVMVDLQDRLIVQCRFCQGTGSVQDVSKWPPVAPCPGCHGAGVHRV